MKKKNTAEPFQLPAIKLPARPSKARMGALVQYCGHDGSFVADVWHVGSVCIIVAPRPVTMDNLQRPATGQETHHIEDFPAAGYWKPEKGIFVIPEEQVTVLGGAA